ncbi:MAG: SusC/RagA family TonB-linked outer membrane protein [Sphingobacteriales bacterium]|nr:SusC/RagA family TonB-linked outer membrane protein [Sphingobacteriales bacterium]OJV98439.1 MAG: hypothetical protein BGO52_11670 [Sphingobacteriales bacterium 44-61]
MKMLSILLFVACMELSATGYSQQITLSFQTSPLEKVLKEIERQTSFRFIYSKSTIELSHPVTINVTNQNLDAILVVCFDKQPLLYEQDGVFIIIKIKPLSKTFNDPGHELFGVIHYENGEPAAGISVQINRTNKVVISDNLGRFYFDEVHDSDLIIVTGAEIEPITVLAGSKKNLTIRVSNKVGGLEETLIKGYYTTTRKLNIGTVDKISQKNISRQPVSNPLAALQGRIPGLFITQATGLPGSTFSILLRGRNSLQRGTEPLFVIDGVPFNTERQTQRSQIAANSPFNLVNPQDIESIEVLKDAEATAIYGSRGANGVILITTKKGKAGKAQMELNVSTAFGRVQQLADFMSTEEYVRMRKEAFSNDGITPGNANAPDLLLWDTTRYTNWKELLTGGTSHIHKVYAKLSGGSAQTRFSFGTTYYQESTVFPGSWGEQRFSMNLNVNHQSEDKKLTAQFSSSYSSDKSSLGQGDLTSFITLSPNAPTLYDSVGHLNWHENNGAFNNPMALLLKTYDNHSEWMTGNFVISYQFLPSLTARISSGYNLQRIQETSLTPISSQNPANRPTGSASFGNSSINNWIIEPQLEYNHSLYRKGKVTVQAGHIFQSKLSHSTIIDAEGYTNDALIRSIAGSSAYQASNNAVDYKYSGAFGRLSVNWDERYLLNLTGRRDGSSRFGEGRRFANFGAAALGWIFSSEPFLDHKPLGLSYGKLRVSYGSSGNDQIGDYMYLDTWTSTNFPYQGTSVLRPTRLQSENYQWEHKRNLDIGLETGFFNNRFLLNATYFNSRSDDQLINYVLPGQTGFSSIVRNFPAIVRNRGIELSFVYKVIQQQDFSWSSDFNLTFQRNRLVSFPGIEQTSYATTYQVGKPLSLLRGYSFNGIHPVNGLYQFNDLNNDGVINTLDQYFVGTRDPTFYGGWQHEFTYKGLELSFFFHFVKQEGTDVLAGSFAGTRVNMPVELLEHWQKPGDVAIYQRYATTGLALPAASQVRSSDAALTDASFIKLRNATISYRLPAAVLRKMHLDQFQFFIQGQNLVTFTRYKGSDPEVQGLTTLPPLRVISTGISITF